MSATGTDSDSEIIRAEGIIEGGKMDKEKETMGKTAGLNLKTSPRDKSV